MKRFIRLVCVMMCLSVAGCDKDDPDFSLPSDEDFNPSSGDGFWMKLGSTEIKTSDIDYYDFSTHLVYLKKENTSLKELDSGSFTVNAGNTEIYSGVFVPLYSSYLPTGPVITTPPIFYSNYLISIDFLDHGNTPDPRGDNRIVVALKSHGQYHAGLSCNIQSIKFSQDKVVVDLELFNPDTYSYYYLDPDKMGTEGFHYFTNGLSFWNKQDYSSYSHHVTVVRPEPWNSWKKDWLSLIESGARKQITITYDDFDELPRGTYDAQFFFPGLANQVAQNELEQDGGRIWLGELRVTKEFKY
jgi:hypothetical protein